MQLGLVLFKFTVSRRRETSEKISSRMRSKHDTRSKKNILLLILSRFSILRYIEGEEVDSFADSDILVTLVCG